MLKLSLKCRVVDIVVKNDGCEIVTNDGSYQSKVVVTCAGLFADRIAKLTHPDLPLRLVRSV